MDSRKSAGFAMALVCMLVGSAWADVVSLPLSSLQLQAMPPEVVSVAAEGHEGEEHLRLTIGAAEGWPQARIALPGDLDRTPYDRIVLRIKRVGPTQSLSVSFLDEGGGRVNDGRYIYRELRQGAYADCVFELTPEEMNQVAVLRIVAKSPTVASEFLVDAIFLAAEDGVLPHRWARERDVYMAEAEGNTIDQEARDLRVINGREYRLAWADEFDSPTADNWTDRIRGYGYANWFQPGDGYAAYPDGEGHLVLALAAYPRDKVMSMVRTQAERDRLADDERTHIPTVAQIWTKDAFVYGYHEIRFKLPLTRGPGIYLCYFGNKGTVDEVEIDVIEQTLYNRQGKLVDYKSSTVHWYSRPPGTPEGQEPDYREVVRNYGNYVSYQFQRLEDDPEEAERLAGLGRDEDERPTEVELLSIQRQGSLPGPLRAFNILDNSTNGLTRKVHIICDNRRRWDDGEWHTAALLWTRDAYYFYYDGEFVARIDQGLLHDPVRAVLGLRVFPGWDEDIVESGRDDVRTTPARVLVDYYRVYRSDECGDVVIPGGP